MNPNQTSSLICNTGGTDHHDGRQDVVVLGKFSSRTHRRGRRRRRRNKPPSPQADHHHRRRRNCGYTSTILLTILTTLVGLLQANHWLTNAQTYNDVLPQQYQHNNILKFEVAEMAPNNTWIGNIRSFDGQLPYLVVPSPQTPEHERKAALNINFSNGDLTTNSVLDREHREQYHFIAIVREPFAEIKCTVTVRDVNDNAPIFLTQTPNETNFVIEVPENQRGTRRVLPLAVDYDTPEFGIKEFRIVSGNTPINMFHLVQHDAPARSTLQQSANLIDDNRSTSLGADSPLSQQSGQSTLIPSQPMVQSSGQAGGSNQILAVGQNSPTFQPNPSPMSSTSGANTPQVALHSKFLIDLEVNQTLDRENQSSYQLVIEAVDGGQPPLITRLMVTVNVQDVNDNDPIFRHKIQECNIREDTAKGTMVLKVHATDADLDSNGQVSYFIKRHSATSQPSLNPTNSDSSDNSNSNNEVQARYSTTNGLNINNSNTKQRSSFQQISITSNSKLAQRQNSNFESYDNSANQNQDLTGSSLAHKTRQTNSLPYPPDQLFDINQTTGEIYLVNQLDFESDQVHELLIEARDQGKPFRSTCTTVKVNVLDVPDDPPPKKQVHEERVQLSNNQFGESSKAEPSAIARNNDYMDAISQHGFNLQNLNLSNWLAQMNSTIVFCIVFAVLFTVGFSVCLVRVKSRQPESDYNDTAGLTPSPNNTQTKPSPNHSSNNLEHSIGIDNAHYRHHDHQRRSNGAFAGLNGSGLGGAFGTPNGKMSRYPCITDSSNLYHNLFPTVQRSRHHSSTSHHMQPDSPADHLMSVGQGDSRGGTLALHNHHHHHHLLGHSPPGHHSLEHHHHNHHPHQYPGANHTTSSLTYAHHHSRAALLQHAHHHQSSHQLSTVHQGVSHVNKGGTMNSHHSAHPPSASPVPATPNTTNSSGLPVNVHEVSSHHHSHHTGHNSLLPSLPQTHQANQLPPTPCRSGPGGMFVWPSSQGPGSTIGFAGLNGSGGNNVTPGSTMDSCGTASGAQVINSQPLDRWLDLGVSSQLVYPHDWAGSYDWDYLDNWTPEHHNLMPLIQAELTGF